MMAFNFGQDRTPIGLFTEDDEERERLEISPEEIVESQADILGIKVIPNKTEREAASALSLMNEELSKISFDQKRTYLDAVEKCPDEVNVEKRLAFLWREDFDAKVSRLLWLTCRMVAICAPSPFPHRTPVHYVLSFSACVRAKSKLAAVRLVNYWEKRKELFAERCFLPLTLRTLEEEIPLITTGLFQLLPSKDSSGRAILAYDASLRDKSKNPLESVARSMWYFFHCLIEDVETQKRGCVILLLVKHAKYNNFDPPFMRALTDFERKYFPIRFVSLHLCHTRPFFRALLPIGKFVMGRRMRARLCFHSGSDRVVVEKLSMYGIAPENVPAHSGGRLVHDQTQWMCDRIFNEEQRQHSAGSNLNHVTAAAFDIQKGEPHCAEKRTKRGHDSTPHEENKEIPVRRSRQASTEKTPHLSGPLEPSFSSNIPSPPGIAGRNQTTVDAVNQLLLNCVNTANADRLNGSGQIPIDGQVSLRQQLPSKNNIDHQIGPFSSLSVPDSDRHYQISSGCNANVNASSNHNTGVHGPMAEQNLPGVLQVPSFETNGARIASQLIRSSPDVSGQASSVMNTHQSQQVRPIVLPGNSQNLSQPQIPRQDQSASLHAEKVEQCSSLPRLLFLPIDEMNVSPFQCLLRKQIEVFVADEELAARTTRGRKKPIHPGQVGIRCRHCRGLPLGSAQQGAMYFPSSLVSMYQTGQKMSNVHFFSDKPCHRIPKEIVSEGMAASRAGVGGGKRYWEEAGAMLGLVDTESGIQFCPSNVKLDFKGS